MHHPLKNFPGGKKNYRIIYKAINYTHTKAEEKCFRRK